MAHTTAPKVVTMDATFLRELIVSLIPSGQCTCGANPISRGLEPQTTGTANQPDYGSVTNSNCCCHPLIVE